MKSIIGAFVLALFIVCLALPNLVFAGAEGSSATGSLKFVLDDGATRFVEFNAKEGLDGQATGDMTYSDPVAVPVDDPDNGETPKTEGVFVKAKFDCMMTVDNRAVMSGEVYDSNVKSNIGQRMLLVVEDNGLDKDRLTWGIYQIPATGWTPSDAELKEDNGASLTWWATDFERKDDVGFKMPVSKIVACQNFPLSSYDFPEIKESGGDLQVLR
ncbi:MAG TPA: hypothetical protein VJ306_22350 [Pyrinomonadaceae bacterium]|jgi:hypothetical protein|nr:hypothetical protein [Pyrinomonadaceae bacterium]